MLQLHVREAQRAQGAAAEAQAAAGKALDQQETELTSLRQQLSAAQVGAMMCRLRVYIRHGWMLSQLHWHINACIWGMVADSLQWLQQGPSID